MLCSSEILYTKSPDRWTLGGVLGAQERFLCYLWVGTGEDTCLSPPSQLAQVSWTHRLWAQANWPQLLSSMSLAG